MNIKTALKKKNKLVGLVSEEFKKVTTYNSILVGNDRPYNVKASIDQWGAYVEELIKLKTQIHTANIPVFDKIFELSELKNQVKSIRSINCDSGKIASHYGSAPEQIKDAVITVTDKDKLIKALEGKIEYIQEQLDDFNYKTSI